MTSEMVGVVLNQPYPFFYERGMEQTRCQFFIDGACSLVVGLPGLVDSEIKVLKGELQIGYIELQWGMLIAFRYEVEGFKPMELMCPFNPVIIPDEHWHEDGQNLEEGHRLVSMIGFDTESGLVKVIRAFTLSPDLHKALVETSIRQRNKAVHEVGIERWHKMNYVEMNNIMARYSNEELWGKSQHVFKVGNGD